MFKEKDGEDLRAELGLTDKRANELVNIIQTIMDQETPDGGYGRTSHVLLNMAGRKDLTEVERVACTFLFACRMLIPKVSKGSISSVYKPGERPGIFPGMVSGMPPGMPNLKGEEFIDIEGGIAGMIVAPEGIDKSELITVLMTSLVSMLKDLPKKDAENFCRHMSISFARMALTGDVKL